jgi:hypothetical protein
LNEVVAEAVPETADFKLNDLVKSTLNKFVVYLTQTTSVLTVEEFI